MVIPESVTTPAPCQGGGRMGTKQQPPLFALASGQDAAAPGNQPPAPTQPTSRSKPTRTSPLLTAQPPLVMAADSSCRQQHP
mmetsp:Transcript_21378/g.54434  ORF Transcript_21378/g.54434 Transcript_21378/m.54434 type:complete len:82 (+) Transcript_21378:1114-1359(+)